MISFVIDKYNSIIYYLNTIEKKFSEEINERGRDFKIEIHCGFASNCENAWYKERYDYEER